MIERRLQVNDLARVIRFTFNLLCEQLRGCRRNNKDSENPTSSHREVPPLRTSCYSSCAQEVSLRNLLDESVDCWRQRDSASRDFRASLSAGKCDNPVPYLTPAVLNW